MNVMGTRMLLAWGLLWLGAGCVTTGGAPGGKAAADGRPAWLVNPHQRYPDALYLVASGDGDTLRSAQNAATANLAKIFESRVNTEDRLFERFSEWSRGRDGGLHSESVLERQITIASAQDIFNIQFSPSYVAADGRVHVLAALDRAETAPIYRERILALAERIRGHVERARSADPMHRYAFTQKAAALALENRMMLAQLEIVSLRERQGLDLGYDLDALTLAAAEASKALTFSVALEQDPERKIAGAVEELMNDLGFTIGASAALRVTGRVTIEPTDLNRPEKFVRYDVLVQVADPQGRILVTFAEKGREGHVSEIEARARAVRIVRTQLQTTLRRKLIAYFKGLVETGGG